ncbi:MAG: hypothetical protein HOI95_21665 [Chromatiales bacterium]|jgi:hypothetical protein|nr:hypothetical protein [Chromatiales bacterium]
MQGKEGTPDKSTSGEATLRAVEAEPSSSPATEKPRATAAESIGDVSESERAPSSMQDTESHALVARLEERITGLERQGRRMRYVVFAAVLGVALMVFDHYFPASIIVQQTLMKSEEVKLVDNAGNTRLFLRMYSRVPVLQLLDNNGKPRMSLGLRFDDTPFIDLSDKTGRTRATFEMTADDEPTLKLFNEDGEVSFAIN